MIPVIYTAKRRSKNLKEHEEAFKSINGVGPTDPPDTSAEIMGVVSELAAMREVPRNVLSAAAFRIKQLSEGTIKVSKARDMLARSLGYPNSGTMGHQTREEDSYRNLLHGKGNLVGVLEDVNATHQANKERVLQVIAEIFAMVKASPIAPDFPDGKLANLTDWDNLVCPLMGQFGLDPNDRASGLIFRLAYASKFPKSLFRTAWRKVYDGDSALRRMVFGQVGAAILRDTCVECMQPEVCYNF